MTIYIMAVNNYVSEPFSLLKREKPVTSKLVKWDITPTLYSKYDNSFLNSAYRPSNFGSSSNDKYSFPLLSRDDFKESVVNYLTSPQKKRSLFFHSVGSKRAEGHVIGGFDYLNNGDDSYFIQYYGFELKARYRRFSLNGKWWKGHTTTNDEYSSSSSLINSWVQDDSEGTIYLDKIQGDITYTNQNFGYLSLGRNKFEIGNNIGGSIILSPDKTNDYGYLKYKLNFGDLSVEFLHASLVSDSLDYYTKVDAPDKYMSLHQFIWEPSKSFKAFVGEQMYYGNRGVDINYFVPLGFWRITEHNQGDRDNILIFGGLEYKPTKSITIYANTIFDELSKSKLFTSWWGNKYALQTGVSKSFVTPKTAKPRVISLDKVGVEFTAIRPWIYTHKYLYAKASNDDQPLGFTDGTNLLKYTFEAEISYFQKKIDHVLHISYMRQGSNYNDYTANYEYEIEDTEEFTSSWLDGDINDTFRLKNELNFNFLYSHQLKLALELTKYNSDDLTKELIISYQTRF